MIPSTNTRPTGTDAPGRGWNAGEATAGAGCPAERRASFSIISARARAGSTPTAANSWPPDRVVELEADRLGAGRAPQRRAQAGRAGPEPGQHVGPEAAALRGHTEQEVLRADPVVAEVLGLLLGHEQRLPEPARQPLPRPGREDVPERAARRFLPPVSSRVVGERAVGRRVVTRARCRSRSAESPARMRRRWPSGSTIDRCSGCRSSRATQSGARYASRAALESRAAVLCRSGRAFGAQRPQPGVAR
jgi:hypothetical protein